MKTLKWFKLVAREGEAGVWVYCTPNGHPYWTPSTTEALRFLETNGYIIRIFGIGDA